MNKNDIKEELISEMKIQLKDTLFYMPGETIEGTIILNPSYKIKIKDNKLHIKMNFIQYEFWEYNNKKIEEVKNIYKTDLDSSSFEYNLIEGENQDFEENKNFGNFSIVLIEKEEEKSITIPFRFKIKENNDKLLPTFQYETKDYILGIRHLLIIKCEEYNSTNYTGLFIGKQKDNNFIEQKAIKEKYDTFFDKINIEIRFPKQSFYFGEKINFEFESDSKLTLGRCWNFNKTLYRKIEWVGYIKNTLINEETFVFEKKEIHSDGTESEEYEDIFGDFTLPLCFSMGGNPIGAAAGAIGGAITLKNSCFLLGSLIGGGIGSIIGTVGGLVLGILITEYSRTKTNFSDKYEIETSKETNDINNKIKEEIQKFVYFKDNKVVGFIKFGGNITPPVNGYYFKCGYNFKIKTNIPGIVSSNESGKTMKLKLDFYDGENYIQEMKKLLSVNK